MTDSTKRGIGCTNCRSNHRKCSYNDDESESCQSCIALDIDCRRDEVIQFRHGLNPSVTTSKGYGRRSYDFSRDQTWLKPADTLTYIDETPELRGIYGNDQVSEDGRPSLGQEPFEFSSPPFRQTESAHGEQGYTPSSVSPSSTQIVGWEQQLAQSCSPAPNYVSLPPWMSLIDGTPGSMLHYQPMDTLCFPVPPSTPPTLAPFLPPAESPKHVVSRWTLRNTQECVLMHHFVQVLASWFDLLDPAQHFARAVPHRAAQCVPLQQAIFALSARHLSRISNLNPYISDKYFKRCIEVLMPVINQTQVIKEDILCTMVILRLLEELDVPLSGCDNQRHLKGIQVLVDAQERSAATAGGLQQAAFWAGLHQEMFMAFITQRRVAPALLSHCHIDRTCSPANDCTWAFRILANFADILAFCYGRSPSSSSHGSPDSISDRKTEWDAVERYTREWAACQPSHFNPTYSAPPAPGEIFPQIHFHFPLETTAALYYHVSRILLAIHNPTLQQDSAAATGAQTISRLRSAARALHDLDTEVREHVRALCGIAICNPWLAPAMTMTSTALTMCGDHFCEVGRTEQQGMMDLLVRNEEKHGWPTGTAQAYLKRLWGWEE